MLDQSKGCKGNGIARYRDASGACCIDTYRIYDSCRNQECLEDMAVMVTDEGQKILDMASAIRIKNLSVLWARIDTEEMPFQKGYFQINTRYFFHAVLDCCTGLGTGQDVAGLCVFDKSVMLYGGEGGISIFKSDIRPDSFCPTVYPSVQQSTNLPRAVVEVAKPVALRLNVLSYEHAKEFGTRICTVNQIPDGVRDSFTGSFREATVGNKVCFLSLGMFSLVRIERPAQLVVPACDTCIPAKSGECEVSHPDPCSLFRSMEFPVGEFYPETVKFSDGAPADSCGCKNSSAE